MLDLSKPIQTKDGTSVRLITDSLKSDRPIIGAIENASGNESVFSWKADGSYTTAGHGLDLVNAPEKMVRYLNVYETQTGFEYLGALHMTANACRKSASNHFGHTAVARVKVEIDAAAVRGKFAE